MKKVIINPAFAIMAAEVEQLNAMAQHTPDWKPTAGEARTIENIFYRVFGTSNAALGDAVVSLEKKQKWTSGERLREIDAKRNIIDELKRLSAFTGLHETVQPEYFINAMRSGRDGICKMIPEVLQVVEETDKGE